MGDLWLDHLKDSNSVGRQEGEKKFKPKPIYCQKAAGYPHLQKILILWIKTT